MLVTGATGLLGRHLQISKDVDRWELIAPGHAALDVTRHDDVIATIHEWKPAAVVHLAYRRDRRSIVDASRNVAEAAAAVKARLVHMSTDVVFGGRARPYVESDVPDPLHDYGRWKAEAEVEVMAACPDAVMVRTSLLYGTDIPGPLVADVQRALDGVPYTFFDDEMRCPAHAADVASAICKVAAMRDVTGPLHIAGPRAVSRAELAVHIARWLGRDPSGLTVGPIGELAASRPQVVVLDCSRAASLGLTCAPPEAHLR
jgi:dTDP-4-dehydrorhamnose reductase